MSLKTICNFFLSVVLLAACSADNDAPTDDLAISIHPTITRATETAFQEGDEIGLTITVDKKAHAANELLTYNGEYFVSQNVKWYSSDKKGEFKAYHPFTEGFIDEFTIQADQTGDGYSQSDFLLAVADNVKPQVQGVALSFVHGMAQLVVTVKNYSADAVTGVTIEGSVNTAWVDMDHQSVTLKFGSDSIRIKAKHLEQDTYRAIIVPSTIIPKITVHFDNGGSLTAKFKQIPLLMGKKYYAMVTVSDENQITDYDITPGGDISDWELGGNLE